MTAVQESAPAEAGTARLASSARILVLRQCLAYVVNAGTYEGRSRVVVGLGSDLPYSVQILEHPLRLVVDIVQS